MSKYFSARSFRFLVLIAIFLCLPAGYVNAQESTPQPVFGRVEGQVRNLTDGADTPTGIPVVLYMLQDFEPVDIMTSTIDSTGGFTFSNVLLEEEWIYVATLDYQNVAYGSSFVNFDGSIDVLQLDIDLYESTTEPIVINVGRLHIIIEFSKGTMLVTELYIFDNISDRVFVGPTGKPESGTLVLPIPENAVNPGVERSMGDSMIPLSSSIIAGDSAYMDTLAVRPGETAQQLMLSYEIPYQDNATISHPLPYHVQSVTLLLPDAGLEVSSGQLQDSGLVAEGMPYMRWDGKNLAAGDILSVQISGELEESQMTGMTVSQSNSGGQETNFPLAISVGDNTTTWVVGIGGLAVGLGIVVYLYVKDRNKSRENPREDCLLAIAELDQAFEDGKISAGKYQLERERLKTELRQWYPSQSDSVGESKHIDDSGND
ncbi:MAG: hypothetical protein JXA42_03005 [Anaerolineales bacterium]|nr:hypothetical protein [Anaerolineales bacterium]